MQELCLLPNNTKSETTNATGTQNLRTLNDLSDQELIRRYQDGNDAAAEVLFARVHKPLVKHIAHRSSRVSLDSDEVEDIVQEVLIKTLRSISNYESRDGASFTTYSQRVADNYLKSRARTEKNHKKKLTCVRIIDRAEESNGNPDDGISEEMLVCPEPGPEEILFAKLQAKQHPEAIRECLDMLTNRERCVLEMDAEGIYMKPAAERLYLEGHSTRLLTPQAVGKIRDKARVKFSKLLAAHGIKVKP